MDQETLSHATHARLHPPLAERPDTLDAVHERIWDLLSEGVINRHSPFHCPTLATVGADGTPQVRTVTLREAERFDRGLRFNSDNRAPKYLELVANPSLSLHVYDKARKQQVRIWGRATLSTGNERAARVWAQTRGMSRQCYRVGVAPGSVVTGAGMAPLEGFGEVEALENFAVVDVTVTALDWLFLKAKGHIRAGFRWADDAAPGTEPEADWLVA